VSFPLLGSRFRFPALNRAVSLFVDGKGYGCVLADLEDASVRDIFYVT
jgi:hypothetical protein